jgi:hypothetical protein
MGTVTSIRFDTEIRALRIRDALVDEINIKDIRRLGCFLGVDVLESRYQAPFSVGPLPDQRTDHRLKP